MSGTSPSAKPAPFWLVASFLGGFFAVAGTAIGLFVVSENRGQAAITTPGPACAEALTVGLDAIRRDRELAFDVSLEHAASLIDSGDTTVVYESGDVRHEASFRVEASEAAGCRLTLHEELAQTEGAPPNRRHGRLASVAIPGCECE
jgi:hypothetical protein